MLHVVPMFFYNFLRKPKQEISLKMSAKEAARQLSDTDENETQTETVPSETSGTTTGKQESSRVYVPMEKVPFMSLEISLDETERSSDEEEDENDEDDEQSFVLKGEALRKDPEGGENFAGNFSAIEGDPGARQQESPLLNLLSSNKELSASPAVVDLVARFSEETPVSGGPSVSSPGSPASGTQQPTKLHRTPVPSEIYCRRMDIKVHDDPTDDEILDPTDALVYGWIHHPYLQEVSEQMNKYLVAAEDDDIMSLCIETILLIRRHPMSCQVKYKTPEFDSFCYPLSYFSAAGWLEGCQAAYEAFPEAIGQEQDSNIGLPLHYACLHQASFEVIQYLVQTYAEAVRITNAKHQTPLHQACRSKDAKLNVVELLLKHYPTAAQLADLSGYTPLHLAIRHGASIEILAALQASSPTVVRTVTLSWHRPLHVAALFGATLETVRWLVKRDPSAIQATGEDFGTVLHYAVESGKCAPEVVEFLRDAYPSALCLTNDNDETPFDVALRAHGTSVAVLELVCPPAFGKAQ